MAEILKQFIKHYPKLKSVNRMKHFVGKMHCSVHRISAYHKFYSMHTT